MLLFSHEEYAECLLHTINIQLFIISFDPRFQPHYFYRNFFVLLRIHAFKQDGGNDFSILLFVVVELHSATNGGHLEALECIMQNFGCLLDIALLKDSLLTSISNDGLQILNLFLVKPLAHIFYLPDISEKVGPQTPITRNNLLDGTQTCKCQ